jgi:hypothetical protein
MGGSEISTVGNSSGGNLPLPVCGCNAVMKLWLSNTDENPKRKFWKCRYSRTNVQSCELLIWDDELEMFFARNGYPQKKIDNGSLKKIESGCNGCEMTTEFLKKFGKDFGKECGQEIWQVLESKKVMKLKKKYEAEKKKNNWLFMALLMSWVFFAVAFNLA